ncbi:alpha/beta hydrolase [candidate division KSB1 bacterium]|nr:alpha/beta hydrolase [candidate division KSB1 bacterium]
MRITDFDVALGDHVLRVRRLSQRGQGTIFFLHDSFGCIDAWRDFPARLALATGHDAIVYDRRGYGKSAPFGPDKRDLDYLHREAASLNEFLAKLGIREAVLFGHSDGGMVALLAASMFPERVKSLIAEGVHVFMDEFSRAAIRVSVEDYESGELRARLERYHGEKTEALFRAWSDTWLADKFHDWSIERELQSVHCPVLVVQGEQDEYGTLAQVEAVARSVSGPVATFVVPYTGHTPHRDAGEAVVKRCGEFVRSQG